MWTVLLAHWPSRWSDALLIEWSVSLEAIYLLNIDQADIHYETRRDSFIDLSLVYNF